MTNRHIDPATRFWNEAEASRTADYDPTDEQQEDVKSAYREASARASERDELDTARDDIDSLRQTFGSFGKAIDFNTRMSKAYKADPATASDLHARAYLSEFPNPPFKAKEPEEKPPADLTEAALDEWHLNQSVRKALRSVPIDKANADDLEQSKALVAQIKEEFPGISLANAIKSAAAVNEAMHMDPHGVATRLASANGLPATQGAVRDQQQAAQYQQQEAALSQWLTQTEAAGGFAEDYRELEPVTLQVLEHMNANGLRTDNVANDLHNAIVYARELTAKARQQQHDKEAAEKARHASRSLSGSHADTKPSDKPGDDDESVEASAARAYRAHAA